jgi:hypothetical protein
MNSIKVLLSLMARHKLHRNLSYRAILQKEQYSFKRTSTLSELIYEAFKITGLFFVFPFLLRKSHARHVVIYHASGKPVIREAFLMKRFGISQSDILFTDTKLFKPLEHNGLTLRKLGKIVKLFGWLMVVITRLLFCPAAKRGPVNWITVTFRTLVSCILMDDKKTSFHRFILDNYIAYIVLDLINTLKLEGESYFYYNTGPLAAYLKYFYLPNSIFGLSTKAQMVEARNYIDDKLIFVKDIRVFGFENIDHDVILGEFTDFKYDIGVFTSLEWVRNENTLIAYHTDHIKEHLLTPEGVGKMYLYNRFREVILDPLKEIILMYPSLKVVFLMHPTERRLMKDEGIIPPYYFEMKLLGCEFQVNETSSVSVINEVKIAVTMYSGVFYQRFENNLPTLLYSGKNETIEKLKFFRYLQKTFTPTDYAQFVFDGAVEMKAKVIGLLK